MTTPLFMLRCVEVGISISDLDLLTIGFVLDMWTERGNVLMRKQAGLSQMIKDVLAFMRSPKKTSRFKLEGVDTTVVIRLYRNPYASDERTRIDGSAEDIFVFGKVLCVNDVFFQDSGRVLHTKLIQRNMTVDS